MPKRVLYGLFAAGDLVAAALIYFNSDRVVIPAILAVAGVLMLVAAVGLAMGKGGARPN
jgi:hypothetical protein